MREPEGLTERTADVLQKVGFLCTAATGFSPQHSLNSGFGFFIGNIWEFLFCNLPKSSIVSFDIVSEVRSRLTKYLLLLDHIETMCNF